MRRLFLVALTALTAGCIAHTPEPALVSTAAGEAARPYVAQAPFPEPEGDLAHIRAYAAANGYTYTPRMEELSMLNYAGWRLDPARPAGYQMVWAGDDTILAVNLTDEADAAAILSRFAPEIRDRVEIHRVAFDRAEMLRLNEELNQALNRIMPVDSISSYNYRTGRFDVFMTDEAKADELRAELPADVLAFTDIQMREAPLIVY